MSYEQLYQQSDCTSSQAGPASAPQNGLFPDAQLSTLLNPSPWSGTVDHVHPTIPQHLAGSHRAAAGAEHAKHRRTRSGCYTCRQRRVKVGLAQSVVQPSNHTHPNHLSSAMRHAHNAKVGRIHRAYYAARLTARQQDVLKAPERAHTRSLAPKQRPLVARNPI